jgi:hypothetical protein
VRYTMILAFAVVLFGCGSSSVPPAAPTGTPAPLPSGPQQPGGWEVLAGSPTSPAQNRHEDLVFLDASNGWLVNARAEVWGTKDGG